MNVSPEDILMLEQLCESLRDSKKKLKKAYHEERRRWRIKRKQLQAWKDAATKDIIKTDGSRLDP